MTPFCKRRKVYLAINGIQSLLKKIIRCNFFSKHSFFLHYIIFLSTYSKIKIKGVVILFRPLLHVFSIITTPSGKNLLNIQQQDFNLTNHFILNTHTHTMIALTPFIYSSCQRRWRWRRKKPSKIKSKGTSSYTNLPIQHTHTRNINRHFISSKHIK